MKSRNLLILFVAALIIITCAVLTNHRRNRPSHAVMLTGTKLLPELDVNAVSKVVVTSPENTTIIAKDGDKWVSLSQHGYPANFEKVRDTLLNLSDLKIGEIRDANADEEEMAVFDLLPPDTPNPSDRSDLGTRIQFFDESGNELASFIMGKTHERKSSPNLPPSMASYGGYPDGRYIRVSNTVYLVSESLVRLTDTPVSWLDTDLTNVKETDIVRMTVRGPDGNRIILNRDKESGDFVVNDLADDEEMDSATVDSLASTFNYLTFSDIANPGMDKAEAGLDKPVILEAVDKTGKMYVLKTGKKVEGKSDNYVTLIAGIDPDVAAASDSKDGDDAKSADTGKQKTRDEVAAMNGKLRGWIFTIPSHRTDVIKPDRSEFVKKKEKAADTDKQSDTGNTAAPPPVTGDTAN